MTRSSPRPSGRSSPPSNSRSRAWRPRPSTCWSARCGATGAAPSACTGSFRTRSFRASRRPRRRWRRGLDRGAAVRDGSVTKHVPVSAPGGASMLDSLPRDWRQATLLGRLLTREGPTPVLVRRGRVLDVSDFAATTSEFAARWRGETDVPGKDLGELEAMPLQPAWDRNEAERGATLLSPVDLQCLKACGVTFAVSALERVIEERARGDVGAAHNVREALEKRVGSQINAVRPGSP